MPGFLLEDDAVQARLGEYDSWIDERKRQAEEAKRAAERALQPVQQAVQPAVQAVQQAVQPAAQGVNDALSAYDTWLSGRQQVTQPAPPPTLVAEQTTGNALPSLSHAEEPATSTDTIAAPDLGGRWKTNFDFGATYTGSYRTGTPHRGVDMVPVQGGIGTEVSAFHPGTVSLIQRDRGAGGLMVYVQDDQGLTHAYMHLANTQPGLKVGDRVSRGTPIAQMGESGTEGSPHLHYEVRKNASTGDPLNQLIDPRPYVAGQRQQAGATGQASAPTPAASSVPTTAGLSGGGELAGRIGDQGQAILTGAADIASWLGEQGQKAVQAVLVTEGGLTGARGDNDKSAGPLQFFGEEGGRSGQLNAFAQAAGMTLEQARQYVIAHPLEAIRWAVGVPSNPGYLGAAIIDGITKGLTGADLATHIQRIGQVSVSPERAGAVWNNLFGQGQPVQRAVQGVEQAVGGARAGAESALAGAVEQSGAARRGAEDLLAGTQRTMADIQRQGAESTAAFDQFRADAQRRSDQFTAGTQGMLDRARQGLESFDPNVGLRQANQMAQDFQATQPSQAVGGYFDRLGTGVQSLGQSFAANPLTPLAPAMAQQVTSGVVRQVADSIGRSDEQVVGGMADAALTNLRNAGVQMTPEQEQFLRTAFKALSPSTLPLSFLGGGSLPARLGLGAASTAGAGVGMAGGEALEPELPEGVRPFAPLVGGLTGGVGLPLLANVGGQALRGTVRGVARAIAEGGPEPGVIKGRAGPGRIEYLGPDEDVVTGRAPGEPPALPGAAPRLGPGRAIVPVEPGPGRPGAAPMATDWDEVVDELSRVGELPGARATPALPGAAVAGQAIEPASEAPSMGGGTVGISQSPTFLLEALRRMYPGAFNRSAVKEGAQNFNDASRGIPGAQALVQVNNTDKTISMLDQGKGMTAQIMEDVFVKLGGSSKPAGAAGGMGTAIKAIMANSEDIWVRSVGRDPATGQLTDSIMHGSGNDFLDGSMHRYYANQGGMPDSELAGAPPEINSVGEGPGGTGTLVWVKARPDAQWADYSLNQWINDFNKTNKTTDQTVRFVVDGQEILPGQAVSSYGPPKAVNEAELPSQFLKTITVPGAEVDIWASPKTDETGYADLMLLNNGQYQAGMTVRLPGSAKMPTTLVADVRATVGPKAIGYPWTADRNDLIDTTKNGIKDYISGELARDMIGQENARVRDIIMKAPMIGQVKLVDDADIGSSYAASTLEGIPKHPGYRKLASIVNDLHENLLAELEGREIPTPVGPGTIGPSHLVGLAVSNKWVGLNVPPSYTPWADTDNAKGILIEPWKIWKEVENSFGGQGAGRSDQIMHYADTLLGVMLHEVSHNASLGSHEEGFAGLLTRIPQFLGSRMQQAITKDLIKRLDAVWDTLVYDLATDAQTFTNAARPGDLARFGVESGAAQPGQPGLRPATGGQDIAGHDLGGPAGGPRAGGAVPAAAGTPPGGQLATGQAAPAVSAGAGPAAPALDVRSGGIRAAEATQTLQQSLAAIKPTRAQIAAANKDWLQMDRVGQRVSGLPPGVNTPRDLAALRVHIDNLIQAGTAGRDWYINSAHKIRDAVGGDMKEAEKLAQLVGMMARNIDPDQNMNYAIEAWNQWKSGIPVANVHRFADVSREAADLLERGIPWDGRKTNSFYINLMEELDPKLLAMRKATVDQWINRAYGYVTKAPSNAQYNFMENEMRRMADARGERPSQIQAQMWVGQMALQAPNQKGELDYSHALARRMGQVGIETEDPEIERLFLDENGVDQVARAFGGLGGHSFEVPGGRQIQIAGALTPKTEPGGQKLRPASRATIEAIAAAKAHLLKRPEVGWTQVFPSATAKDANAMDIDVGRLLSAQETQDLRAALNSALGQGSYALTATEHGAWVRNTSSMANPQFHKAVNGAVGTLQSEGQATTAPVRADSNTLTNDWEAQPNGESYLDAIQRGGREEAFRSIQDSLGARIEAAQQSGPRALGGAAPGAAAEPPPGAPGAAEPGVPGAADAGRGTPRPPGAPLGGAEGQASAQFALRGGQFAGGVAASEATMSEEDKANPWVRVSRDFAAGFGAAVLPQATAGIGRGIARQAQGRAPSLSELADIRTRLGPPPPLPGMPGPVVPSRTVAETVSAVGKQALLTGLGTHIVNIATQLFETSRMVASKVMAGQGEQAYLGIRAGINAVPRALEQAATTFRTGVSTTTPAGEKTTAWFPIFRMIGAIDDFFRVVGGHMGGAMEAQRLVSEAGAKTAADVRTVLAANESKIYDAGTKTAAASVFQTVGQSTVKDTSTSFGRWKQAFLEATAKTPAWADRLTAAGKQAFGAAIDALVPFSGMPARLFDISFGRTPVIGEIRYGIAFGRAVASGDKAAAQEALGDLGVQSILSAIVLQQVADDNVRGPDDREHPSSVRIGGQWVSYDRWGPLQLPLAIPASVSDEIRKTGNKPDQTYLNYMSAVLNATAKSARQAFWLDSAFDLLENIGKGNLMGGVGQTALGYTDRLTPALLNNIAQATDDNIREVSKEFPRNVVERAQSRIPYLAQILPSQVEQTTGGARIRDKQGPLGVLGGVETGQQPPVEKEIYRLNREGYSISPPRANPTTITVAGSEIKLTPAEQRALGQARGERIERLIGTRMASASWDTLTDDQKARAISSALSAATAQNEANWRRMTPAAEQRERIAAGKRVVGRLSDQSEFGSFTAPRTAA